MAQEDILDAYSVGTLCWVPHKERGWIGAEVVKRESRGSEVVVQLKDDEGNENEVKVDSGSRKGEEELPALRNPAVLEKTEDLTFLSHLNEPSVLHTILLRYSLRQIYTYSGIVLIAVNPFSPQEELYSSSMVQAYCGRRKGELEPHVFAIAEDAYRCMVDPQNRAINQTIIVSGESGAGKTVSAKYIMRYFATVEDPFTAQSRIETDDVAPQTRNNLSEVEEQILATNPIMEAFGNAKTTRNDNSSRFGKYLEILFDASKKIIGARIRTYLLERSRLVYQPLTERNYHVFYQLLAGAPHAEKKRLGISDGPLAFNYTAQGGPENMAITGVNDAKDFESLQRALSTIGVTVERQWQIFSILAALLHLGNIPIAGGSGNASIDMNDASLGAATDLLAIDKAEFVKWLTKKQIVMRSDKIVTSLNATAATVVRDSFAKFIYAALFEWLVAATNVSLAGDTSRVTSFIGVLDIYGFEHFAKNSFEQFCINYANEKLQQEFNAHVFKLEQDEYLREQIDWTFINFADNQICIELVESKLGILSILDEESRLPQGSDANFVQKLLTTVGAKKEFAPVFKKPRFGGNAFTVAHYAHDVTYDADGFLDKNRDTVPDEQLALLNASNNEFLRQVLDAAADSSAGAAADASAPAGAAAAASKPGPLRAGPSKPKKPTLGSIFKGSLISLMHTVSSTNVHYIRCIKPNDDKAAWVFEPRMVLSQLRACGVLETIRISTSGYPTRWGFAEFAQRYYMLVPSSLWEAQSDLRHLCLAMLQAGTASPDMYQIGLTKVFLRAGMLAKFEQLRSQRINALTTLIQKNFLRYMAVKKYSATRRAILGIQVAVRARNARRLAQSIRQERAALLIQTLLRTHIQRSRFLDTQRAISRLQALVRSRLARSAYLEASRDASVILIQRACRAYLAKASFSTTKRRVILLQSCTRRRIAHRELKQLRTEARSSEHLKSVSYKLENKVVELTQNLQKRAAENKALQKQLDNSQARLNDWMSKYDAVKHELDILTSKSILDDPEYTKLSQDKADTESRLNDALEKLRAHEGHVAQLQQQIDSSSAQSKSLGPDVLASKASDNPSVAALKSEVASLRDQLAHLGQAPGTHSRGAVIRQGTNNLALSASAADATPSPALSARRALPTANPDDDTTVDYSDQADLEQRIADDVMNLLSDASTLDQDVLKGLIENLSIPQPSLRHPIHQREVFFPAHLISLVVNEMWKYGMIKESERFFAVTMQTLQDFVMSFKGEDVIIPAIFWLSNVHEIWSFVCVAEADIMQGYGPGTEGIGLPYDFADYEHLVEVVKHDLESVEFNIYHTMIQEVKKRLNKMAIPAVVETQALPGFVATDSTKIFGISLGSQSPAFSTDNVVSLLNKVWKAFKCYYVEHSIGEQCIIEFMKLIGVTCFNDILMRRSFLSWKRAMQIQYNITRLEEWCKAHDVPEGSLQLEHILQATKLLQLKKGTLEDVNIIYDVCWLLTPQQVQKFFANYYVADYEYPILPEVIKAVNSRVVEGDKKDHLFLPTDDSAAQYIVPEPRELTGIDTYIPSWLSVPHLRRIVQIISPEIERVDSEIPHDI